MSFRRTSKNELTHVCRAVYKLREKELKNSEYRLAECRHEMSGIFYFPSELSLGVSLNKRCT